MTPGRAVTVAFRGQPGVIQVHGAPVAAWHEAGIFGFIGLIGIVAAVATAAWRGLAAARGHERALVGWALMAAFAAWLVEFLTNPLYFQEWGWFAGALL